MKRSTTCSFSLWKFPELSSQVSGTWLVTSITSVSPSQCPRECPIHMSAGLSKSGRSMYTVRLAAANSYAIRIAVGVCTIWNGNGM